MGKALVVNAVVAVLVDALSLWRVLDAELCTAEEGQILDIESTRDEGHNIGRGISGLNVSPLGANLVAPARCAVILKGCVLLERSGIERGKVRVLSPVRAAPSSERGTVEPGNSVKGDVLHNGIVGVASC